MSRREVLYRQPERNAVCRVCDETIHRNQDYMISWYSYRNTGQYIHICIPCIKDLYKMVPEDE